MVPGSGSRAANTGVTDVRAASLAGRSASRLPLATGESPLWWPGQWTMASFLGSQRACRSSRIVSLFFSFSFSRQEPPLSIDGPIYVRCGKGVSAVSINGQVFFFSTSFEGFS